MTYTICTSGDVFDFLGCESDTRTSHASGVNNLIQECSAELESMLGRYIQPTTFTNIVLLSGVNCVINEDTMFLCGKYRDTYEITALSEYNTILGPVSGYNLGDYLLDSDIGTISRQNNIWATEPYALKISGKTGLNSGGNVRGDIKRIVIEMVSAKSGLWTNVVNTADGEVITVRGTVRDDIKELIKKLKYTQY